MSNAFAILALLGEIPVGYRWVSSPADADAAQRPEVIGSDILLRAWQRRAGPRFEHRRRIPSK